MDILNFIFRLGVVFAIFGFLWWLVNLGLMLLRGNREKTIPETYIIKFIRYFFLVDVTLLFCLDQGGGFIELNSTILAGLILLMYFLGKLQNAKIKTNLFHFQGPGGKSIIDQFKPVFNLKAEAIVIVLNIVIFSLLIIYPKYISNPISNWFYESIVDIEDTPVFGFIFKIIGFFFVLSIFLKLAQAFMTLITGQNPKNQNDRFKDDNQDDDFDDFTEIK